MLLDNRFDARCNLVQPVSFAGVIRQENPEEYGWFVRPVRANRVPETHNIWTEHSLYVTDYRSKLLLVRYSSGDVHDSNYRAVSGGMPRNRKLART